MARVRLVALGPEVAGQLVTAEAFLAGNAEQRQQGQSTALGYTSRERSRGAMQGETAEQAQGKHAFRRAIQLQGDSRPERGLEDQRAAITMIGSHRRTRQHFWQSRRWGAMR